MQTAIPVFTLLINICVIIICVINAQSLRNEVCDYNDLIIDRELDFLIVSKSWLKPTDPDYIFRVNSLCILCVACVCGYSLQRSVFS